MVEKEVIGEPAYSYEGISNPELKNFFERSVEPAIQRVIEWPIEISKVSAIFSAAFRLDRIQLSDIIHTVRRLGVIGLFLLREPGEKGNGIRYSLDRDGVRIMGALSWEFAERRGKKTLLTERIGRVAQALGDHPLREKLNPALLPPKLPTSPLPPSQSNREEDEVPDEEEVVIKRPSLGKVPYIDGQELAEGRFWTLKELEELLPCIPKGWEEISYPKILWLLDGHPYTRAISQQIIFIGAAYAKDPRELWLFDQLMDNLNYDELRLGIRRCIAMLERRPDINNLTELFQLSVRWVQRRQQAAHDSSY